MKPPEPVTAWTKPAAPEPTQCPCGATVGAEYVEPVFGDEKMTGGRPLMGTGVWQPRETCAACSAKHQKEIQAAAMEAKKAEHAKRVQAALERAGFRPREADMTWSGLRAQGSVLAALEAWCRGEKALYLHGKDTGAGKTYAAVAALKHYIARTAEAGLFRPVPVLVKDLRLAVGRFRDGQLLEGLMHAPALVLDDMGVERPTETVLEGLYTIVDHWYATKKPYMIVTSNLSLDDLSRHLDDRIASRLAGHCRIIELTGEDRRLPGFEERR